MDLSFVGIDMKMKLMSAMAITTLKQNARQTLLECLKCVTYMTACETAEVQKSARVVDMIAKKCLSWFIVRFPIQLLVSLIPEVDHCEVCGRSYKKPTPKNGTFKIAVVIDEPQLMDQKEFFDLIINKSNTPLPDGVWLGEKIQMFPNEFENTDMISIFPGLTSYFGKHCWLCSRVCAHSFGCWKCY